MGRGGISALRFSKASLRVANYITLSHFWVLFAVLVMVLINCKYKGKLKNSAIHHMRYLGLKRLRGDISSVEIPIQFRGFDNHAALSSRAVWVMSHSPLETYFLTLSMYFDLQEGSFYFLEHVASIVLLEIFTTIETL